MKIQVKLYGDMVKFGQAGENVFSLTLSSPAVVRDVLNHLNIPDDYPSTILVNGRRTDLSKSIKPNSTLVIMPEISGG